MGHNLVGQCDVPQDLGKVLEITAGDFFTIALKEDGTVQAWGINEAGEVSVPPDLTQVASLGGGMYHHSGVIKDDGSIHLWGRNNYGQASAPKNLTNTILSNSNLKYSDLSGALLRYTDLSGADLTGANLTNADFTSANLQGANLSGAIINGAIFENAFAVDLTGTIFNESPEEFNITTSIVRSPSGNAEKIRIIIPTSRNNTYKIQSSTNLSEWRSIETNILGTGDLLERVFDLDQPSNYFRAIQD